MAMHRIEQFMASDYNTFTPGNDTTGNLYDIKWEAAPPDNNDEGDNTGTYQTREVVITITPKHSLYKRDIVFRGVMVENL